jgi:hypothetical protein
MKEKIIDFIREINFKKIIKIIVIFIIAILLFEIGVFVGFHKASFQKDWSNNYRDNFIGGKGPRQMEKMRALDFKDTPNSHGAIGRIIRKDSFEIVIMDDKDMIEKIIVINDKTNFRSMKNTIYFDDFKIDDFVVVLGDPNPQGKIEAKLIRLIPQPELIRNFNN